MGGRHQARSNPLAGRHPFPALPSPEVPLLPLPRQDHEPGTGNGEKVPPNRLIQQSPYLLGMPTTRSTGTPGEEAFPGEGEEKTIFLSIGYSACHWCHVMKRSRSDPMVAKLLNDVFVASR